MANGLKLVRKSRFKNPRSFWLTEARSRRKFPPAGWLEAEDLGVGHLVLGPVAPAFDQYGFGVVEQAVEHGRGDGGVVVEDPRPVLVRPGW